MTTAAEYFCKLDRSILRGEGGVCGIDGLVQVPVHDGVHDSIHDAAHIASAHTWLKEVRQRLGAVTGIRPQALHKIGSMKKDGFAVAESLDLAVSCRE